MAGFLSRVVSVSNTIDEELLHCPDGCSIVILEALNNAGEDVFEWLGAWLTLGSVLGAVLQESLAGDDVLHVHVGTPCRQLNGTVAVDESIIPGCQQLWFSLLCDEGGFWLQWLWVAKPALLLAMFSAQAVSS